MIQQMKYEKRQNATFTPEEGVIGDALDLSAVDLARAVSAGAIDPEKHTRRVLARVSDLNPVINAFSTIDELFSIAQSERVYKESLENLGKTQPASAANTDLPGVPFPIKDLCAVEGLPLEFGSRDCQGNIATNTDGVAQKILDANTITIGKTTTSEFGFVGYSEPHGNKFTATPWDITRNAGGSSSGAGAAVASGMVPIAHGSDGGGSIRIPAGFCGVVGIKPGRGFVSHGPYKSVGLGLPTNGVLARTVADTAAGLNVISGPQPGDWFVYPRTIFDVDQLINQEAEKNVLEGLRIAVLVEPLNVDADVCPQSLAAVERAVKIFTSLGATVEKVSAPITPEQWSAFMPFWQAWSAGIPVSDEESLRPISQWLRKVGRNLSASQLTAAEASIQGIARTMGQAFTDFDIVLTPTLGTPPVKTEWVYLPDDPEEDFRRQCIMSPWASSWNIFGPAAISVPLHRETVEGTELPFGVQLAGTQLGQEGLLLHLARMLESADPWPHIITPSIA